MRRRSLISPPQSIMFLRPSVLQRQSDECTSSEDHKRPLTTIPKVGRPRRDLGHERTSPQRVAIDAMS
jgi:hypothetical protein